MKGFARLAVPIGLAVLTGVAFAVPPGPGQPFGGDDTGCVTDTKDHGKCSDAIAKAFGKAVTTVAGCHVKQADAAYSTSIGKPKTVDEEACEVFDSVKHKSAKEKLDAAIAKVTALCSAATLSGASALETTLFATKTTPNSLDALNAGAYCQGTADIDPGDDAGKIPDGANAKNFLKCEDAVNKNIGKMVAAEIGCHVKAASSYFKGKDFDEEACEDIGGGKGALGKFNAARDKLVAKGICPPCLDGAGQDALAAAAISRFDNDNQKFYPCGTPCACAGGTPSRLSFVTTVGSGTCGHLDADGNPNFSQINCGGLYFGGAGVGVPLPAAIPDNGTSLLNVTNCSGTTLTLANTTSTQTGSIRSCTSVGCLFGQPLPIPNGSHLGSTTSTCVINTVSTDATGTADCNAGSTTGLNLPLTSGLFLTGDTLLPNRCNGGTNLGGNCTPVGSACPGGGTCVNDTGRCANNGNPCTADGDCPSSTCETGACVAGVNAGKGCIFDTDCPSSTCRTLIEPCPICNPTSLKCNGGPNDGLTCSPDDTAVNGDYPTSHDCPPPPGQFLGNLPIAFLLDSGTQSKTSVDLPGQVNVFCGFCRNKVTNQFKSPAVPCTSDANCTGLTGCPGATACNSCGQKTAGAFTGNDVARTIVAQGVAAGALTTGGAAKPSKIVSIFCIPPTFNILVDASADLPGPGTTALQGNTQLLP